MHPRKTGVAIAFCSIALACGGRSGGRSSDAGAEVAATDAAREDNQEFLDADADLQDSWIGAKESGFPTPEELRKQWKALFPNATIALGDDGFSAFLFLPEPMQWVLARCEDSAGAITENCVKVLLRFGADGLALGRVDAIEDSLSYDPWYLYEASGQSDFVPPPAGLAFLEPVSAAAVEEQDGRFTVRLSYPEGVAATIRVESDADRRFRVEWTPELSGPPLAYFRLRAQVDPTERFYGLGAWHDRLNHRGFTRPLQIEVDLDSESANNEGHVRIPLLIGTNGWGIFLDSLAGMVADVATQADDRLEVMVGSGPATPSGLVWYLMTADRQNLYEPIRHYYDITGAPRLPAPWALGPWVWRDEGADQAKVLADLEAIRDHDLATTGYWVDRPYASAVNSFDFEPADYEDPAAMVSRAHDLGFQIALWHAPYVDPKDPDSRPYYDEAVEKGYFPPRIGITFDKWGPLVDFTNPEASAWWQGLLDRYRQLGVAGYKLDYAEEVVLGAFGQRTPWRFHDGSDDRTMHHRYQWWYHRVYSEMLSSGGGFLLCRTATTGDQVHGPILWPGDLDATFWPAGHEFQKDGYPKKAVGGFPASILYGLSAGVSGFPFYGSDTGGYIHAPPDKELMTRWFEQTALSSVMQVGNGASTVPWELGGPDGYDEEMLDWYRTYARLHLRLWPYEWTLANEMPRTGRPIQRPLGLEYPELDVGPEDEFEYLFGEDLLVAPVVADGAREKDVLFPPGTWLDFWDGTAYEGPARRTVPAPLGKLPLFLRAGGMVPMLRPTIDTLPPTTDPDRVDSFATRPGPLYARTSRPWFSEARRVLFDGSLLRLDRDPDDEHLLIFDATAGTTFNDGVIYEVHGVEAAPDRVIMDGLVVHPQAPACGAPANDPDADILIAADCSPVVLEVHGHNSDVQGGSLLPRLPDPAALQSVEAGWAFVEGATPSFFVRIPFGHEAIAVLE